MNRAQRRAALSAASSRGNWDWERRPISAEDTRPFPDLRNIVAAWVNDLYAVQRYDNQTEWGLVIQLSVRSHHGRTIPWDDLQRIKDELTGEAATAIEVYPAADDVVDKAPMRHLWILPQTVKLPFGLHRAESWGHAPA